MDIRELISVEEEKRWLEYKPSLNWGNPDHRAEIVKAILAISNIEGGGFIIIGMKEINGGWKPTGMSKKDLDSFKKSDDVKDHLGKYADPYIDFVLKKDKYDGKDFIIIRINEFEEIPVINKFEKVHDKQNLYPGRMYTRTPIAKIQSRQVQNSIEMREILNLAIDKGVKIYIKTAREAGLILDLKEFPIEKDEDEFKKQIEKLKK